MFRPRTASESVALGDLNLAARALLSSDFRSQECSKADIHGAEAKCQTAT